MSVVGIVVMSRRSGRSRQAKVPGFASQEDRPGDKAVKRKNTKNVPPVEEEVPSEDDAVDPVEGKTGKSVIQI